jgi:hypothetical protein
MRHVKTTLGFAGEFKLENDGGVIFNKIYCKHFYIFQNVPLVNNNMVIKVIIYKSIIKIKDNSSHL